MTEYWSADSTNGVKGDPTPATAEKGEAALAEIIRELRARPIKPRVPHQVRPVQPLGIAKT